MILKNSRLLYGHCLEDIVHLRTVIHINKPRENESEILSLYIKI